MTSIEQLPDLVIEHMMDFLPWKDRRACSAVSWRWYGLANSTAALQDTVINLPKISDIQKLSAGFKFSRVCINGFKNNTRVDIIDDATLSVLSNCGHNIMALEFLVPDLHASELTKLFKTLPRLRKLVLFCLYLREAESSGPFELPMLEELRFEVVASNVDIATFSKIFSASPFLRILSGILSRGGIADIQLLSSLISRLESIEHFRMLVENNTWNKALVSCLSPNLLGLVLLLSPDECPLKPIVERFSKLQHLSMIKHGFTQDNPCLDNCLKFELLKLQNVRHASFSNLKLSLISPFIKCYSHQLETLSFCLEHDEVPHWQTLQEPMPQLKQLDLSITLINNDLFVFHSINSIFLLFPKLEVLKINIDRIDRCEGEDTFYCDKIVQSLAYHCPFLKWCFFDIPKGKLLNLAAFNRLTNLLYLRCRFSNVEQIEKFSLPHLEEICLEDIISVVDELAGNGPRLSEMRNKGVAISVGSFNRRRRLPKFSRDIRI